MKIHKILGTFSTKKDGTPFITKTLKPYKKQSIQFAEYGDVIFSIPVFDKEYKEGDDVRGTAGDIKEFNGKKYGNWNFPKSKAKLESEAKDAEIERLKKLVNQK